MSAWRIGAASRRRAMASESPASGDRRWKDGALYRHDRLAPGSSAASRGQFGVSPQASRHRRQHRIPVALRCNSGETVVHRPHAEVGSPATMLRRSCDDERSTTSASHFMQIHRRRECRRVRRRASMPTCSRSR
jgi:hypothetical protein